MNSKQIFFDEKSNTIFEEYKNMKIKKMCVNIVEPNETLINIKLWGRKFWLVYIPHRQYLCSI